MKILVTGSAGFIGYHFSKKLISNNIQVLGIDNINEYYDIKLKISRLNKLKSFKLFKFIKKDLSQFKSLETLLIKENITAVVHLAAQPGVRYSIENPQAYIQANIHGFINLLEAVRKTKIKNFIYASSSSVYGDTNLIPFDENQNTNQPVSLYAATKRSNEIMSHVYSDMYNIHTTGLRFFTVYGPWGRPDMAYYDFARKISNNHTINVFNNGEMMRDFTYIDDIVEGIYKVMLKKEQQIKKNINKDKYLIFNLGNNQPINLLNFIKIIESNLNKKAKIKLFPMQPGDVTRTFANLENIQKFINYNPTISIEHGLKSFIDWYREYHA